MADQNKNEETGINSSLEIIAPKKATSRKKKENAGSVVKPAAAGRTRRKTSNPSAPEETVQSPLSETGTKKSGSRRKKQEDIGSSKTPIEQKSKVAAKPKADYQSSLFDEKPLRTQATQENISIVRKKPIDAKAKLYSQVLSSVHGQELRDFSVNLASIFDGALIEAIKFIENSSHKTLVLISGFTDVKEIITPLATNDGKNAFDHLMRSDQALIKREIKRLFSELNKKYNYASDDSPEKDNHDIEDNEKDLILFCNIIRLSIQWCCEIILRDKYGLNNNTSDSESLKYIFFKTIIESIYTNLKTSPVSIKMASHLIETNCLIIVKGIVDFSNDIDAISSNIQLRRDGANTVEYRISRFAQQGLSDWISNYTAITSYDNSLSQNLIGMEIMLNENNISAFERLDEPHETQKEHGDENNQFTTPKENEKIIDQAVAVNYTENDVLELQSSDHGTITLLPSPEAEKEIHLTKQEDSQQDNTSGQNYNITTIPTVEKKKYINKYFMIFFMIFLLVGIAYLIRIDKSKYSQSEKAHTDAHVSEPNTVDYNKMENTLYSNPEIGKLLALYKSYFQTDYERLINNFINKGYIANNSRINSNAIPAIVEEIAAKRKESISKLQLSDMDKIFEEEKNLIQKLASKASSDCKVLLTHTDKSLINSAKSDTYLADILNVSMSELDAIQNASGYPENRLFLGDKDKIEIANKASSLPNFNLSSVDIDSFLSKTSENNINDCKKTLTMMDLIHSLPEKIRFKIEQQVLSQ